MGAPDLSLDRNRRESTDSAIVELLNEQGEILRLVLSPGLRYHIVTANSMQKTTLLASLPAPPASAIVTADGGLISNLRVMENLTLPASYHLRVQTDELEHLLRQLLHETGFDDQAIGQLVAKLPAQLSRYEKRLVSFARAVLLQPRVLVYDALWDGMNKCELDNIRQFDAILRTLCPSATALFVHGEHQAGPGIEAGLVLRYGEKA